ncbi:MAG TPA: hypothetical protein VLA41_08960 [Burkholderiales bacterium]|nr:hypothetical protein [Burkholderiales bacterium]
MRFSENCVTNAEEMQMYTIMEEELFLSPESVISGVLAEHEVGGPEIDFEEDATSVDWDDVPAYA